MIDALRTPIGRYGGALANARPDDLAAHVIRAAVDRNGLPAEQIDEVYMGCTNQAGEDNRNVARMGLLLAGLPVEVPGVTVNRLCASGLEAVNQAARQIKLGEADLVLAGGVESMTRAPLAMPKPDRSFPRGGPTVYDTTIGWRFVNPRMEELHGTDSMGETAENVAERFGVSRADQDEFALESHRRALAAQEAGRFDDEIVPVPVPQPKGEPVTVHSDEGPRAGHDAREARRACAPSSARAAPSPPATPRSSTTAPRASCWRAPERARELGREPLARIVSTGAAGVEPRVMGIGPIPATRKALAAAGLTSRDIDLVELNEAFASQVLACARELELDPDRLNVNGGAIALGHPLGASGARLLGTLIYEMRRRGARHGLATMCIGVAGLARWSRLCGQRDPYVADSYVVCVRRARGSAAR